MKGKSNEPDSTSTKLKKELLSLTKSLANMVIIVVVPQNIGCCWGERLWQYDEESLRWQDWEASYVTFIVHLITIDQFPQQTVNWKRRWKSHVIYTWITCDLDMNHMWFWYENHMCFWHESRVILTWITSDPEMNHKWFWDESHVFLRL